MSQRNLFDAEGADRQKAIAMEQVASTSSAKRWSTQVMQIICELAKVVPEFTTDRVEYELTRRGVGPPKEKRALGPAMRAAGRHGWIELTDRVSKSVMPSNHRRPKAIWKSRLY